MEPPGERLRRTAVPLAAALAVGMLGVACAAEQGSTPPPATEATTAAMPTVEINIPPAPPNARPLPDVEREEWFNGVSENYLPSTLAYRYKPTDFQELPRNYLANENTPPEGHLAPVMDIALGPDGHLVYSDYTPGGLNSYELDAFSAAMKPNEDLFKTAVKRGNLDRVAVYISDPADASYDDDGVIASYHALDFSHKDKHLRSTAFAVLNPIKTASSENLSVSTRHELIHALTEDSALSDPSPGETPERPSVQELAQYQAICAKIREQSLNNLTVRAGKLQSDVRKMAKELDPEYRPFLEKSAVDLGKASEYAKTQPHNTDSTAINPSTIIRECFAENPWHAGLRRAEQAGLPSPKMPDGIRALYIDMDKDWHEGMAQSGIYSILRELDHIPSSGEKHFGHPWDGWDELITSTIDLALTYPKEFGTDISRLNSGDQALAIELMRASLDTLTAQNPELIDLASTAEAKVLDVVHG